MSLPTRGVRYAYPSTLEGEGSVRLGARGISLKECFIWKGAVTSRNYGAIRKNKIWYLVHRYFYGKYKEPIPKGLTIDHLCKNTLCININHLEAVTSKINTLRGNSASAINARKTHCHKGHLLPTIKNRRGERVCQPCKKGETK